jgi:hypothetical protein
MASRPVAAGCTCNVIGRVGPAAAGLSKFKGRFTLLLVALTLFMLLVCFTTGAGMQGRGFLFGSVFSGIA